MTMQSTVIVCDFVYIAAPCSPFPDAPLDAGARARLRAVALGGGAEMPQIARADRRYRQDDRYVDGSEPAIDDGTAADVRTEPHILLDQRRQLRPCGFDVERSLRQPVHLDVTLGPRTQTPGLRGGCIVMEIGKRQRNPLRIDVREAGAADQHVDAVANRIAPNPMPQEFDGALGAVFGQHAGAAQFEKFQPALPLDQLREPVLAGGIKSAMTFRDNLAEQATGCDRETRRMSGGERNVEDQQVIANRVEFVEIAPRDEVHGPGRRGHLLIEDSITQPLGTAHVDAAAGQADLERTQPPECSGRCERMRAQWRIRQAAGLPEC